MSPIRSLLRDRRGLAATELALLTPFLVLLFAATGEFVGHVRAWFRLEQTVATTANVGSRLEAMASADVAALFDVAKSVASPATAWSTGSSLVRARTVIGVVSGTASGNAVAWVCSRGDAGLAPRVAGTAALPNGFRVPQGQTVLVVEVVSTTALWQLFFTTLGTAPIRTHAVVRPRFAQLATLSGGCPA